MSGLAPTVTTTGATPPLAGLPVSTVPGVSADVLLTAPDNFVPSKGDVVRGFAEMSDQYNPPSIREKAAEGFKKFVGLRKFFDPRSYRAGLLAYHVDHASRETRDLGDGYRKYPRMERLVELAAKNDPYAKFQIDTAIHDFHLGWFPLKTQVEVLALVGFSGHTHALTKLFRYLDYQAADRKIKKDITSRTFSAAEAARHCFYPYILEVLRKHLPRASEFPFMKPEVQKFFTEYKVESLINLAISGRGTAIDILIYLGDIGRFDINEKLLAAIDAAVSKE